MERKRIKKRDIIFAKFAKVLAVLALAACLAGCGQTGLPEGFDEEKIRESAMESIGYFNNRDYKSIIAMGSEELKKSITEEQFAEAGDPFLDTRGEFQKIVKEVFAGNTDSKTGAAYGGVVMVGEYEEGKIQFTIAFDERMELVQFLIK
ncbi:MAG: DUF3887 domain-containing protein [Eubacteriales bacterium]|nr:DUF3887 domain-containing protein [Eubacteriales bacterium]